MKKAAVGWLEKNTFHVIANQMKMNQGMKSSICPVIHVNGNHLSGGVHLSNEHLSVTILVS